MLDKEIISRHYIRQDIEYYDGDTMQLKEIKDFNDAINFWKIIFYEGHGLRHGHLIGILDNSMRFDQIAALFAAFELGLQVVLLPEKPTTSDGRLSKLESITNAYGLLELIVTGGTITSLMGVEAMVHKYSKKVIDRESTVESYTIKDPELYNYLSTAIFPAPKDTAVITTSSGSLNSPRIVLYSHQFLHRLCVRGAQHFGYHNSSVCHSKNMHHAWALSGSLLPGLYAAKLHYGEGNSFEPSTVGKFVNLVRNTKVEKVLLSTKDMLDNLIDHMLQNNLKFEHKLEILVAGFVLTKDYVNKIKLINLFQLNSSYGESGILGPIVTRLINQDTDLDTFDYHSIGFLNPDNFYSMEVIPGGVSVLCPALIDGPYILDDKIEKRGDEYFYYGRNNLLRINEVEFLLSEVLDLIQENFNGDFDLCVDMMYQKLYLAVWAGDPDVGKINQALKDKFLRLSISSVKKLKRSDWTGEIKIDQEALRAEFRKDFD